MFLPFLVKGIILYNIQDKKIDGLDNCVLVTNSHLFGTKLGFDHKFPVRCKR